MTAIQGKLLRRYKRFLADIELNSGEVVVAYCCNTGKLLGVPENATVLLSDHGDDTKRKLRYTWEWYWDTQTWVGINTGHANAMVHDLLLAKKIPGLEAYTTIQREVKYGKNSRIDFLLEGEKGRYFLEVKSVHFKRGNCAVFPDCPTVRGQKHLGELALIIDDTAKAPTKAGVLYLVQRDDCDYFELAADLDPAYANASIAAKAAGVEMMAVALTLSVGLSTATSLVSYIHSIPELGHESKNHKPHYQLAKVYDRV